MEGSRKASDARLVTVHRAGAEVGVTLCGGNLRGVYVESLEEDSPAWGADGLLPGDLILEVWTHTHIHTDCTPPHTHNILCSLVLRKLLRHIIFITTNLYHQAANLSCLDRKSVV